MRVRDVAAGGRRGDGGCSSAPGRSSHRARRDRGQTDRETDHATSVSVGRMRVRDVAAGGRRGDGGCSSAPGRSSHRA